MKGLAATAGHGRVPLIRVARIVHNPVFSITWLLLGTFWVSWPFLAGGFAGVGTSAIVTLFVKWLALVSGLFLVAGFRNPLLRRRQDAGDRES